MRGFVAVLLPAAIVVAIIAGLAACPPAAVLRGCGKDTDCKGARICVQRACVDSTRAARPPKDGGAPDLGRSSDGADAGEAGAAPVLSLPLGASAQFHVDALHSGRSRFGAPTAAPHEIMHVATGGVVYSSPVIADDMLVFGSHDRSIYGVSLGGGLSASAGPAGIRDQTVDITWRKATGDLVWCSPALGEGGSVVYVGSDDDHLYAFNLADGALKWQFQTGPCRNAVSVGPEGARCDVDGVSVGSDGTIYVASDGLYALAPDGTLKWKFASGGVRPAHCAGSPAVAPDGTIYIGCQDDTIYAVNSDGTKRWDFRAGDDIDSSAAIGADGTVYIGSDDRKLYALATDGQLRFSLATGGPVQSSPAIGADGTVYVGSFDGSLYAVRPNGTVLFTFRTADRILSSPLVDANGVILFGSEDDRLYALEPSGRLLWSVLMDGDVDGTPALGSDGTIYVGVDDRALHALR